MQEATLCWIQAIALFPHEHVPHNELGNIYGRAGDPPPSSSDIHIPLTDIFEGSYTLTTQSYPNFVLTLC